ncbi:hypothetical protein Btru_023851 [Bulinus truncatus]|nr:hypothetical protein Btru_023851 [Bulinus truncatus]
MRYRLEVPPDFISRPVSPLIVSPKRPEPVSPYFSAYPMYPSPPPYPAYPPGQPPGYWTMPLPSPPVPTEGSEGEKAERTDRTKKRKKKKRTKKESEDRVDEEATLPNYIRKVHKPEAHWNRIYDPTGKRYLVDKRANVKNGGRVGPDDRNNISDDDEAETAKGITFRDEFALLADGLNASYNALTDFSRFPHIQLCETTRVFLSPDASSDNTFIHANYIDGCIRGGVSYIAAMSPFNDDTVLDFWRMIYQRKIETIVMMTNVLEGGIVKCAEYWPPCSETVSTLGHFLIQTVSTRSYADYVIRKIKVKSQSSVDCLEVTQFQYTAWPPQGTPASPVTLLDMRYWVRRHHEETRSTHILVHCGTGVSRTAVFVAIDALIDQYEQQGGVNVFKYVSQMRTSRPMMVRSLDHYIFIYTALQDEFEAGDTNIDLEKGIQNAMVSLSQINPNTGQTYLEDQFDLLNYFTLDFLADDVNIVRLLDNRASKTSPVTKRQSSVKPIFVDGYRNRNQFVLMDTPCDEEIADFWRLVCLHNIVSIVQLGKDKSTSRSKKSGRRGGDDRKQRPTTGLTGNYRADTITSKRHDVTLARDILLEEITESGHVVKRKIRHFSIPSRHIVCGGRHKKKHEKKGKKRKEKRKKVRYRGIRNEPRVSRSDYNMSHRSDGNLADEHEYGRGEMCDRKVRVLTPGNGERRSGFYVRGGNFNQKELRDGRTEINVPIQQYTNHIDSRRDYQGTYFKEAGAVPKSDRNDNVAFLVLKDGRLVRTCRNDTKSIHKRPAKHFVSNRQVYSRANTTEHLYVKYPAKYKKCHTSDVRRKNYGAKREHLGTSAGDPANRRLVAKRSSRSESTSRLNRATRHRLLGTSGSMSGRGPGQLSNYRSIALSPGQGSTSRARCSPPQRKRPNAFPDKLRQRYMKMTNSSTNNRNRYIQSIGKLKQFLNPRRLAKLSKQPGQKFTDSLPKSISPEPQRTCQKRRRTTDARAEKTDTCNSAFTTVLPITDCKSLCSCEAAQAKGYICLPTSAPKSPTESKKTQDFYHKSRENSRKPVISVANVRRSKEMFNLEHIDLRSTLAQCSTNTSYSTEGSTSSHNISTSSTGEDTTRSVSIEAPTLTENIQRSSSISKDENESATKTSKLPYRVKLQKKAKDKTKFYQEKVCKKALKPIELLDLNELIWRWQSSPHSDIKQYTAQGPVLIHCPPGKGDASLLCACAQVCEQIQEDQEVDAYHVVKHLRRRYPSAVGSFAEYDFLHRVLFHYVTEYMDDVSLSDRWKNRHRNEQFHRPAIHSGHVIRMRYAGPNTSPPSTPDNTTFNRASSLPSFQGHVQDNLSIVEAPMVSIKGRTQQGAIPWLSPRPPLAIDLSTRPKLQSCEVEMCSGASLTDEANSGEKDLGEVNICSVQESDLGEINICSIQESESGRNKIGPVQEFDGLELSRKKETEQCAENTDLDVSDVILT